MGKLYSIISALLIAIWPATAFGQTGYEWWLDNDVSGRQSGTISGDRLDLQVDMSGMSEGLHGFNCRINRADGTWGSVYRRTILIPVSDPKTNPVAEAFEYWIDDNSGAKVSGALSSGSNAYTVDLQNVSEGLHRLNYRVRTQYGDWGSIYCQYFLIPESNPKTNPVAEAFEYWIDDNYGSKVTGSLSAGSNAYTVDVQELSEGLHRLNYRVRTQYGDWGSIYCQYFCNVTPKPASVRSYEYWLDNDFSNRKSGPLESGQMTFSVDLSGFDMTGDFHLFNMRLGDSVDGWGSIYQKILVFNDHKYDKNVTGYRHRINGIDLGFVDVDGGLVDSHTFAVDLPEDLSFTTSYSGVPSFNGNVVSVEVNDSIHYSIQIKSGMGWSAPRTWDFALSHNFSTTAVEMAVNSSHDFATPNSGEFAAVKFTSTGVPLYFRSTVPVALDLYRNGEKVREFSAEEIAGMGQAELEGGEYFGILHDVADNEAKQFTFHLMDTPNVVPTPVITFEEGKITITCSREDAEIRYTLDGTDPTAESQLYTEPFALSRNATVKARAFLQGSDIEPSAIVELIVDSYKTATPTGTFDSASRLLTITCATEGASILYTFDREGEWTPYTGPIAVDGNVTVYAKATRDGYNDSEITEIVISDVKCAGVSFIYNGRYLRIETEEPGASIRYTSDGSDPASGSEYSGEFDVQGLRLVKAVAVKDGYMNSEVAEMRINRYADEDHAETSAGGLLESCFEWDDSGLPNSVESFRVEGRLNEADYQFIRSMEALRHLDMEKVGEAVIPDGAFMGSRLVSISLPADLTEYGDSILSNTATLSSVVWNSRTRNIEPRLTDGLVNPNVLLYVPAEATVTAPRDLNIVTEGDAPSVTLRYGYPYYAARNFHAGDISLTREFLQETEIGVCRGWETIVLPFQPTTITHETKGAAVPFGVWDGDTEGMKPFWLYSAVPDGWEATGSILACEPYIISMPNSPEYVSSANLDGKITFSAKDINIGPGSNHARTTPWMDGTTFEGTFMPVEESGLLSLNVGSTDGGLLPGSAFVPDATTVPFGAYVRGASGRKAMPLFGDGSGVSLPTVMDSGLVVETPAPGMLRISSMRERNVTVTTVTGVTVRTLRLRPGESVTIEGLTRDLYIVAGRKVMVR